MPIAPTTDRNNPRGAFAAGAAFLLAYWIFGFDGITFSDDVYYLLAGKKFWEGTMEINEYHFSTRWGAYVPAGLAGWLLSFDPHTVSLVSLLSYLGTLLLLLRILPRDRSPWVLVFWFCTQVYLLHFLTKVYPDSLLVFWVTLVPFSAIFRYEKPFLAALGLVSALFFGFLTKETIVFLAAFPVLLFVLDWKDKKPNLSFYGYLLAMGFLFGATYLAYFWLKFGDPLYRLQSLQAGHYISEYTYADKGAWVILKRLTILPILTFVERSYWLWLVFSLPAWVQLRKKQGSPGLEFGLASLCLLTGFWAMSTNLAFYNPLYLNPRHLIVLVPILAFLVSMGWAVWQESLRIRKAMVFLVALGVAVSLLQQDWKMVGFQASFVGILLWRNLPMKEWAVALLLLIPAFASVYYQGKLKAYPEFLDALKSEVGNPSDQSPILVNNFVHFSREVLFPDDASAQSLLLPIEKLDSVRTQLPQQFRVFIYDYYQHAYPKEQLDIDKLRDFLSQEAELVAEERGHRVWKGTFRRK
ncbi:hypothetical protein J0A68_19350 [Algoriphagus sp. H41]|uniref:4-amino-4-deoxy-L-arabinose transferase n=1 Tax=Algoriphagus oliviformis TaxID=2811231 RepID=A0ABS3C8G2_9BACT|nr:hypothetical protein [Algoriphagus oliviformis]MBN7813120.1 hypothetical protein [Algoriphagus oliviformis]